MKFLLQKDATVRGREGGREAALLLRLFRREALEAQGRSQGPGREAPAALLPTAHCPLPTPHSPLPTPAPTGFLPARLAATTEDAEGSALDEASSVCSVLNARNHPKIPPLFSFPPSN